MPRLNRAALLLTSGALFVSSCYQAPQTPLANSSRGPTAPLLAQTSSGITSQRRVLSTIDCPDGGSVTPKADAPTQVPQRVTKLPNGSAFHLDFKERRTDSTPSSDKIWFADQTPFEIRFQEGSAFSVLDGDATDGIAEVQLPSGLYDTYVSTAGKPGGSVVVSDPLYFMRDTVGSGTGKGDWAHLGVRALPMPGSFGGGPFVLKFEPQGLTAFTSRLFTATDPATTPPVPPLPPKVTQLTGPDEVAPGATGSLSATVSDPNGDALVYRWTTTTPTGEVISDNPAGGQTAVWTAPLPSGTYQVGLTVEEAYYSTTLCAPLTIQVPNICPKATLSGPNGSTLPGSVNSGSTLTLTAHGEDANGDPLSWRWTSGGGTLQANGATATWTAPSTSGDVTVSAYVSDEQGCETPVTQTFKVLAPTPTPGPTIAPTYGPGTKIRMGLYATINKTVISQDVDLSGLPRLTGAGVLKVGYFEPSLTFDYVYETDNQGKNVQFSWNYKTWGKYPSTPKAESRIYAGDVKEGQVNSTATYYRVGIPGNSAVLLDANKVPLAATRYTMSSVPYPANTAISGLTMLKAVQKQVLPVRKYKLYFDDGSIGESDSYSSGLVTGRIIGVSSKGSVVMPVGARFRCGVMDNSNVTALEAFTPVLPPAIQRHF